MTKICNPSLYTLKISFQALSCKKAISGDFFLTKHKTPYLGRLLSLLAEAAQMT
jgi:hypothetical protein